MAGERAAKASLVALPGDVLLEIAGRVAKSSSRPMDDLHSLRASCKTLENVVKKSFVRKQVALGREKEAMEHEKINQVTPWDDVVQVERYIITLVKNMARSGNPEACFDYALDCMFVEFNKVACLENLHRAATSSHMESMYLLGILLCNGKERDNAKQYLVQTGTDWLYMYPEGMRHLLMIIKDRYGNPPIYITENGVGDMDKGDLSMEKALNDDMRLNYLKEHIAMLKQAKYSGANVRGHFTWSLVDNFEWQNGYTQRFGLIYIDRKDKLKRHMKKSAKWFAEFNGVSGDGNIKVDSSAVPRAVPAAAAVAA